jgi:hypothetical protein
LKAPKKAKIFQEEVRGKKTRKKVMLIMSASYYGSDLG